MKAFIKLTICGLLLLAAACKQEFPLPVQTRNLNLLVVEGLLNSGPGPTVIRLSRTFNLSKIDSLKPELRAQVTVESENGTGTAFVLTGNTRGEYIHSQLTLNSGQKYRLRVKTTDGKEYLSDAVPVQEAPPIDSVHWRRTEDNIEILVTTHDPQDQTRYYRWEYNETWELNSYWPTHFQYVNKQVIGRTDPLEIFYCWKHESSKKILLGSSAKLTDDVISAAPMLNITQGVEKIGVRYSVLVTQYALTREGYQFWEIMRKNTEQVGTLFDPQPSQMPSNIHSLSDPDEPVIGFISAGTFTQKRLFIRRSEVEPWRYRVFCEERIIPNIPDSLEFFFGSKAYIPISEYFSPFGGGLVGYTSGTQPCVDCATSGGSYTRPSFW